MLSMPLHRHRDDPGAGAGGDLDVCDLAFVKACTDDAALLAPQMRMRAGGGELSLCELAPVLVRACVCACACAHTYAVSAAGHVSADTTWDVARRSTHTYDLALAQDSCGPCGTQHRACMLRKEISRLMSSVIIKSIC